MKTIKEMASEIRINTISDENHDFYFETEDQWKKSLLKYSDKELLEIFPEAKEIIPEKIKEWEEKLQTSKTKLKDVLSYVLSQKTGEFTIWFCEQVIKLFLMPPILKVQKHISRLTKMNSVANPIINKNKMKYENWQEKVEIARRFPIAELARGKLDIRPSGENFSCLCPFHDERHSSFYIYTNTNRFVCFGCQEKGDVISLTMHLYGLDFKGAVQMLQN